LSGWFLDAGVLLARADAADSQHRFASALLRVPDPLSTLDLAYYEVVNVALRGWRDAALAGDLRRAVATIDRDGGLVRMDEPLAAATAELAERHGLSAYDAAYVAAAGRLGVPLVSCDVRDLVEPGLAVTPAQALGQ
jgi:predicted nucleic acid-binding protein